MSRYATDLKYAHKFPDKVKLVINETGMAYIALDPSSLESGLNWAKGYYRKDNEFKPEVVEYDNGTFEFQLSKAAETSYQSGKLSFWILDIICSDGRVFQVGINSEALNQTLLESTCVNGKLVGKFYVGRTNAQQSLTQKDGLFYKQYLNQIEEKKRPLDNKYIVGDKIKNGKTHYIYLGEGRNILRRDNYRFVNGKNPLVLNLDSSESVYFYIVINGWGSYITNDKYKMNGRFVEHTDATLETYTSDGNKPLKYYPQDYINLKRVVDLDLINRLIHEDGTFIITNLK